MSFQVYCLRSVEIHFFSPYFFNSITVTSSNSGKIVYVFGHSRNKIEQYILYTSPLAPCFH